MRPPLPRLLAPIAVVPFMLASGAAAQCPPQRLTSPSDFAGDFGARLAINDRHLIIGDPLDYTLCRDPFCPNGYAWAYERDGDGQWVFTQRIEPAGLGWSMGFGRAIALDGDRAIVTRTLGFECGMPYVFEYDGERWIEVGLLCAPAGRAGQGSGVALYRDMALVFGSDPNVLVYHEVSGEWTLTEDLNNPTGTSPSDFGVALDLDDQWVAIGAPSEQVAAIFGGAVYMYRRLDGGRLEYAQQLLAPDILNGPQFGIDVEVEGDTLVVGGDLSDREFDEQGAVYVYQLVDGRWELRQELTHANPARRDRFGVELSLEGDTLLVGASGDRTPTSDGTVYVFRRGTDGVWRQAAELVPDVPAAGYGFSARLAGGFAAVGARDTFVAGEFSGSVDIFDLSCIICRPDLDADGALTVFDFLLFFNLFEDGDLQADLDGDGELTLFDFLAFQTAFDAGCA